MSLSRPASLTGPLAAICRCVYQHADDKGIIGVELNKQLVQVAGKSLQVKPVNLARQEAPVVLSCAEWSFAFLHVDLHQSNSMLLLHLHGHTCR